MFYELHRRVWYKYVICTQQDAKWIASIPLHNITLSVSFLSSIPSIGMGVYHKECVSPDEDMNDTLVFEAFRWCRANGMLVTHARLNSRRYRVISEYGGELRGFAAGKLSHTLRTAYRFGSQSCWEHFVAVAIGKLEHSRIVAIVLIDLSRMMMIWPFFQP